MGILSNINCRSCGDGPKEKLSTKDARTWAKKHGTDAHDNPYQGLRYSNYSKSQDKKD